MILGFRLIHSEDNKELRQANAVAREIFNKYDDPEFMPHLSLLYGMYPDDIKKKMIDGLDVECEFEVDKIYLYYTDGYPKEWHEEHVYDLANKDDEIIF